MATETHESTEAAGHGESSGGLPQFDPQWWPGQIAWTLIVFDSPPLIRIAPPVPTSSASRAFDATASVVSKGTGCVVVSARTTDWIPAANGSSSSRTLNIESGSQRGCRDTARE